MPQILFIFFIIFSAQFFIDSNASATEEQLQRMLDKGKVDNRRRRISSDNRWIIDEDQLQRLLEWAAKDSDQVLYSSVDEFFTRAFDIPYSRMNQEMGKKHLDEQTRRSIAEEIYVEIDVNGDGLIQMKEYVAMLLKVHKDKHYRRKETDELIHFNAEIDKRQREYEEFRVALRRELDGKFEEEQRKYETKMEYYANRAMIDKMEQLRLSHGPRMAKLRANLDEIVANEDRKQDDRVKKARRLFEERQFEERQLIEKHSWSELKFPGKSSEDSSEDSELSQDEQHSEL